MIHHYLTDIEINRLNELHTVKKCGSCIDCGTKKCEYHAVPNNIACENYHK